MKRLLAAVAVFNLTCATAAFADPALLLFGGGDRRTFLGCVNCAETDQASICNQYGQFGSEYQTDSIWNQYGTYGSQYSNYSPWNQYAQPTVVIVDGNGGFYGFFTANRYAAKRTNITALNRLAEAAAGSSDLTALRDMFCAIR